MIKFKDFKKTIPLNLFIYISIDHDLQFTTVKHLNGTYNNYYVEDVGELGGKKIVTLRRSCLV